jgi:signal transduction histidine kinase
MPVLALPHVLLDGYAYLASDLFEFDPATRRASERAAVDELATPVVVVDRERRVVRLNETAVETLTDGHEAAADGTGPLRSASAALGEPLATLGLGFDPAEPPETVELRVGGRRRTFGVTASPLTDTTDTQVGYTLVLQDITAERRRRQRLGVLNRVLRHNLRNDLSVVQLYAEQLVETGRGETPELAATIGAQADGLLELGEKARRAADALDTEGDRRSIPVAAIIGEAVDDGEAVTDDGEERERDGVTVTVPAGLTARVDPAPLALAVSNLVENAREHGAPPIRVTAEGDGDEVVIRVRDEGAGVPDHELDMLRAETETALEHGSGLGLWLVRWGVDAVGGELTVDTTDGTTATLRVPGLVADTEREPDETDVGANAVGETTAN